MHSRLVVSYLLSLVCHSPLWSHDMCLIQNFKFCRNQSNIEKNKMQREIKCQALCPMALAISAEYCNMLTPRGFRSCWVSYASLLASSTLSGPGMSRNTSVVVGSWDPPKVSMNGCVQLCVCVLECVFVVLVIKNLVVYNE